MTSEARRDLAAAVAELFQRVTALETELRELRDNEANHATAGARFAAMYDDFTDHFRGTRAEVTAKLAGYLPDVQRVVGSHGVVDVGAGRGEWLTLLREAGVPASGVDSSPTFVAAGRAAGLEIELGDAVAYLARLPADSVDMVTAFHVIEHLDIDELLALLEAARRVLRPGGCVLVETPNPANLVMAACDFYNDPTHRAPLPSALTAYLVSTQGFDDIEVRPLHRKVPGYEGSGNGDAHPLLTTVSELLFGPQDYAVLGYKLGH